MSRKFLRWITAAAAAALAVTMGVAAVAEEIPAGTGHSHTYQEWILLEPTCAQPGYKHIACVDCGESLAGSMQQIPALGHVWGDSIRVEPTCTGWGYISRWCLRCNSVDNISLAPGHGYGSVFVSQHNGAHALTCEACGDVIEEACALVETKLGGIPCAVCPVCGYIRYDGQEDALQIRCIEQARAEGRLLDGAELVVLETIQPELPNAARKIFTAYLLKDREILPLRGSVQLHIPCEDDVQGLKLLRMNDDGELTELPYEILDGGISFETDALGVFLLMAE